jgi:hypothetical protein
MIRMLAFICALLWLSGCSSARVGQVGMVNSFTQNRNLSRAVEMLEGGKAGEAARLLTAICDAKGVDGVTDEALFRLALLSLNDRDGTGQSHRILQRLRKEYPRSPWTAQAGPLAEFIDTADELRRQNKNYRALNQNLSRENKELNQNIEKLKQLDMELERKSR